MKRRSSLTFRLIASATLVSILILAAAGYLLSTLFQAALERNFDARLEAVMDSLLAVVELDEEGRLTQRESLADGRFTLPLSGWYWQVFPVGGSDTARTLASASLLEQRMDIPEEYRRQSSDGAVGFFMRDADGNTLRVLKQRFHLPGSDALIAFVVTGNYDELSAEITAFNNTLILVLTILGLGLVLAIFLQVQYGLRPLRQLRAALSDVRSGNADRIEGDYAVEIDTVVREINALIHANAEVIDRARTQVGNLAHALKTPLSIITNEGAASPGPLANKIAEQAQIMRDQVNLYLDRARRAARAQTLGAATPVDPIVGSLTRTLQRIYAERSVAVETAVAEGLRFRGERQDLEEMVGNLLDNAFKWADRRIRVEAVLNEPSHESDWRWLSITVDDDGPGLPPERREEALKRGSRLDETKPGSGLGLSIVAEAAAMYHGSLTLDSSPQNGLRACLRLPAAA